MGLTVVQKILQDHGGDVAVEQSSSLGTTFPTHHSLDSFGRKCFGKPSCDVNGSLAIRTLPAYRSKMIDGNSAARLSGAPVRN